ncbi:TIGR02281 family clan AA aspartic protease [uncultured Sphingomonas sp.]|uniref:retropepsin-like aspartic protease family protein n=1 Tax=uncultured Sphingomonas sp. TaxID=158754 RepID=UPI0035CBB0C3
MRSFVIAAMAIAVWTGWALGGGRRPAPAPLGATVLGATTGSWQTPHATGGTLVLPAGWQGHYFVNGDVAGTPVRFLVDTGASTVSLSREQARAVGVDVDHLTFDQRMGTASGTAQGALVTLPRLRIGDIQMLDVQAVVIDSPNEIALLGQSFLGRLDKVSIEGEQMTLTKR